MGSFKTSRTGGNVVHRIDLGGGGRRRQRPRRRPFERLDGGLSGGPAAAGRLDPAAIPGAAPGLADRVRRQAPSVDLPRPATGPGAPSDVPARVSSAVPTEDLGARRQIDLLERRLAKMTRLLEEQEQEVAMVRAQPVEAGVASVFREVQGLEGGGKEVERKKALMSRIFEANLDLRKRIISG